MALTLRVTSFHSQALGADSTRGFGVQGGSIGRALDNDWVLPDPEKYVSSHHAQIMCRGGSAMISPLGDVLAGPLYNEEGILYADLDLAEVARGKFDFDVVGHYARPDVFQLVVNEQTMSPVQTLDP